MVKLMNKKMGAVVIEREFDVPLSKIWDAITNRDSMEKWYFNLKEFRAEVGFEFRFKGGTEEREYLHICKITEVVENKKLVYSWSYKGIKGSTLVIFELFEENGVSKLKLAHEGLDSFPTDNPDMSEENFAAGWTYIVGTSLKNFLEENN